MSDIKPRPEDLLTRSDAARVEEQAESNRRMDPELLVMGRMLRLLEELDEPAKGRVVRYLYDRWSKEAKP